MTWEDSWPGGRKYHLENIKWMTDEKKSIDAKIFKGNYESGCSVLAASLIIHHKYKHHSSWKCSPVITSNTHLSPRSSHHALTHIMERNLHFNSVKQTCHTAGDNPIILLAHLVASNPVNTSDNHFFWINFSSLRDFFGPLTGVQRMFMSVCLSVGQTVFIFLTLSAQHTESDRVRANKASSCF